MMNQCETLSPRETALILGVGRNTCYRLIHAGVIPVLRLGRTIRVPRPALEDLLRNPERLTTGKK